MNDHIHVERARRASTHNADEFEAITKSVAGEIKITPKYGTKFSANVSVCRLHRVGMAILNIDPMRAHIEPQHDCYCLTIPIVNSCYIKNGFAAQEYTRNKAHILYPDRTLHSEHKGKSKLLGVTFLINDHDELAEKILGSSNALQPTKDSSLSLITPSGNELARKLIHTWGEINQKGTALISGLSTKELEDDLIAALLLAMEENHRSLIQQKTGKVGSKRITQAEDYLLANLSEPVSRARLAEIAGVSIRSLSRAFVKRHGVGPMKFLKERRMEAVRMELMSAAPESTNVSDVALRYGFSELGKFSLFYKSMYKEKPSETLRN